MSTISNVNWNKIKLQSSLIAAIGLMTLSAISFNYGLNFVGEWGFLITVVVWVSFTVIQFIGNDLDNHEDWVFTALWFFTYMVGIGAGTWALYGFISVPNEYLRWMIAVGLSGAAEIAPERLIVMFLRSTGVIGNRLSLQKQSPIRSYDPDDHKTMQSDFRTPVSKYKPQHRPQ